MGNFWQEKNGVFEVKAGSDIASTIAEAITLSAQQKRTITFEFNGVTVSVCSDSNRELIYRDWSRAVHGYIDKNVDPHPSFVLTDAELANDARIEAANEQAYEERRTKRSAKAKTNRESVEAKLVNAAGIELADEAGWQTFKTVNSDDYGGAVVAYSERWARLMQVEMSKGKGLEEIAQATSQEADFEGLTGFMYGCAVSALAKLWKHGEQLRRWHNSKTQLGNEGEKANASGGVLNPAVLIIG